VDAFVRLALMPGRRNGSELTVPVQPVELAAASASAFEIVYLRHYRDVYRYVLGLTGEREEAEDIVAETFERALRAWSRRREMPERPLPWLLITARHRATDGWRRARRFARLGLGLRTRADPADGERAAFWMWFAALARVLTSRQREVLLLRYQRDLTDGEIGRVMGLSTSGVRSLVARAIDGLRAHPELLR
jgi:RNA polymerase sigma-70 factor (ECF subfamily)